MNTPRQPRYESLDVWRGIACLSVVVFHSTAGYITTAETNARTWDNGGSFCEWLLLVIDWFWFGVPLFFVISGYCISASADIARRKPHRGTRFFTRRFRRIYPPLWAYLGLTACTTLLLSSTTLPGPIFNLDYPLPYPGYLHWEQWLGTVTLTESWRHHVFGPGTQYYTAVLWSLCYEEQFYLIVGLIVLICPRWLFPAMAAITALVILNAYDWSRLLGPTYSAYRHPMSGVFLDGLWLPFAAGVCLYYMLNYASDRMRLVLETGLICALVTSVLSVGSLRALINNLPANVGFGAGFALLLYRLAPFDARIAAARITAPLQFCGRMCYSLYLIHAPITLIIGWNCYRIGIRSPESVLLITVPCCVVTSVAVAYLFHRLVEKRFQNQPDSAKSHASTGADGDTNGAVRVGIFERFRRVLQRKRSADQLGKRESGVLQL